MPMAGLPYRNFENRDLAKSEKIRRLVAQQAGAIDLFRAAREEGLRTLKEAAIEKVFQGKTTTTEMVRVTGK